VRPILYDHSELVSPEHCINYIVNNLRGWNRLEIAAAYPDSADPMPRAKSFLLDLPGMGAVQKFVFLAGFPIGVAGVIPIDSDSGSLYFVGTEKLEEHGVRIAIMFRKSLFQVAKERGFKRYTCASLAGNPKSPRWFDVLGGRLNRIEQDKFGTSYEIYDWSF
jgi:hypothetical protein